MRKHSSRQPAETAVATLDPTLPAGCRPLRWGPPWPSVDARLHISGVSGVWAYAGHMECGNVYRFVEVVPWEWRNNKRWAPRGVGPIERVFVEREA